MKWTDMQQKVIDSRFGNLLVSAAAGSGKTAVLVERIIEMVMGKNSEGEKVYDEMDIDELLVVTFTRAAAAQMKEKIADVLEKLTEEMYYDEHLVKQISLLPKAEITTIDSFCLSIVKENFNLLGIDASFDIADDAEMELIKSDVMDEFLEECYQEGTPDFYALIESLARKESDHAIIDLIHRIAKIATSFPRPYIWLQQAKDALCIESYEQLSEAPWYQAYEEYVRLVLRSAEKMAEDCLGICNQDQGPAGYAKAIEADLEMLDSFINIKELDNLCDETIKFATLGRNKAEQTDEKLQATVKTIREKYKKSIKDALSELVPSDVILAEIKMMSGQLTTLLDLTERYMQKLAAVKREKSLYEFHDIEEFALQVVCKGYDENGHATPSETGCAISKRYREIFIDEYQDSNFLQEDILQCVSGHGKDINNMFMVGDIKQSIYRFRMARPDLFLEKYRTYTNEPSDNHKLILSNNFRSRELILDIVNAVFFPLMGEDLGGIDYNEEAALQPPPKIHAGQDNTNVKVQSDIEADTIKTQFKSKADHKGELILIEHDTSDMEDSPDKYAAEAVVIANRINQLVNGEEPYYVEDHIDTDGNPVYRKATYRDIVVLARGVKNLAAAFDESFEKAGIPLYIESENGYFDAVEVQTILSMLAIIDNAYLDYELAAVLRSPLVDMNEDELAYLVGIFNRDFHENDGNRKLSSVYLYEKILYYVNFNRNMDSEHYVNKEQNLNTEKDKEIVSKLKPFLELLFYLKQNRNYMTISEMIHYILNETGYYWYVGAMQMGKRRQANLDMLIYRADSYENSSFKGLFHFLRYVDRLKIHDIDFAEANTFGEQEDAVRVMTIHKSKGLEFPIVFVCNLGKRFPNMEAKESVVIHSDYYLASFAVDPVLRMKKNTFMRRALLQAGKQEMYAEEMRILYVALTRAKEKLIMTGCVDNIEKLKEKCMLTTLRHQKLSYIDKTLALGYIQWILAALMNWDRLDDCIDLIYTNASEGYHVFEAWNASHVRKEMQTETLISDEKIYEQVKANLLWKYPYEKKRQIKSKMSITEIKKLQNQGEENPGGTFYEQKSSLNSSEIPVLAIMKTEKSVMGNEVGTVMHKIMELIDFNKCSEWEVAEQVDTIFKQGIIEEAFRPYISCKKIYQMLNSELGRRMAHADTLGKLRREQQFYIAMKPENVLPDYDDQSDEPIVVQGIIDAYFIENDKVYLMDYKTDRVEAIDELVDRYRVQLDKYAETIEQITGYPVAGKCIYSFHLEEQIWF